MKTVLCALALCLCLAVPAQAQHRACFSGNCHVGHVATVNTFASPYVVATPFVPTVSVAVPVAVASPVVASPVASPVVSAPVVSTFPVAVSTPTLYGTGYCSGFTSTPLVFGSTRVFHRRR